MIAPSVYGDLPGFAEALARALDPAYDLSPPISPTPAAIAGAELPVAYNVEERLFDVPEVMSPEAARDICQFAWTVASTEKKSALSDRWAVAELDRLGFSRPDHLAKVMSIGTGRRQRRKG